MKVPNQPVETIIVWSEAKPTSGAAPLKVAFTADPPANVSDAFYTWQFGDGGATDDRAVGRRTPSPSPASTR